MDFMLLVLGIFLFGIAFALLFIAAHNWKG